MSDIQSYAEQPQTDVEERGAWLATSRGQSWSLFDPHPSEVYFEDIVLGLSRCCRYAGQLREAVDFYSVAEHSALMTQYAIEAKIVRRYEDAMAILLHDASEAFYGDVPTPLKKAMPGYVEAENKAQSVINHAFGLTSETVKIPKFVIKSLDLAIRMDERKFLINEPAASNGAKIDWGRDAEIEPLGLRIYGLPPKDAKRVFLETFEDCSKLPMLESSKIHIERFQKEADRLLDRDFILSL